MIKNFVWNVGKKKDKPPISSSVNLEDDVALLLDARKKSMHRPSGWYFDICKQ